MEKTIKKILWDVETQYDFIMPDGNLSVQGAYEMIENFGKAIQHFQEKGYSILGSVDAHLGAEEIAGTDDYFPLHCIKGTKGQQKIPQTQGDILYVSDKEYEPKALDMIADEIMDSKRVYFEKQEVSFLSNPNAKPLIEKLGIEEVYLIGVATNICVKAADEAFKEMGIQTYLVENAIKGLDVPGYTEKQGLDEMLNTGTKLYSF